MNRLEWKALHRNARLRAKSIAQIDRHGRGMCRMRLDHGFTWFNLDCERIGNRPACVTIQPAIIRDRSIATRIAAELEWSRYFRTRREYGSIDRQRNHNAARSCIADARAIRLSASKFHEAPRLSADIATLEASRPDLYEGAAS